ncbi:putative GCN5-related N-acetyltransferase [Klebsiella pneumoniae]|nr:putative GCN5-related N-acetyltransferase [Klebsiella pneumoniae]VFS19947.1 Uncharacterised protein [Serratia liquefaciens]
MEQQLTIEMIADAFSYDITGFDCGEEALNTFLKEHLKRQHDGQILRGYALVSGIPFPGCWVITPYRGVVSSEACCRLKLSKRKSRIKMRQA